MDPKTLGDLGHVLQSSAINNSPSLPVNLRKENRESWQAMKISGSGQKRVEWAVKHDGDSKENSYSSANSAICKSYNSLTRGNKYFTSFCHHYLSPRVSLH